MEGALWRSSTAALERAGRCLLPPTCWKLWTGTSASMARATDTCLPARAFRSSTHRGYLKSFTRAAQLAAIPERFTPHSLRHVFASALLARGVPITDVAEWLGHRSIEVTYRIYGHLVPSAWGRAREALDAEYEARSKAG